MTKRHEVSIDYFAFIKLFPRPVLKTFLIPMELQIITAPSFIKADKSLPEFAAANESISRYSELNKISPGIFPGAEYLGDALYLYPEEDVLNKICNSLKDDPKLLEVALYGLSEGARLKYLKDLALNEKNSQVLTEREIFAKTLGAHLNLSHLAELHNREDLEQDSKFKSYTQYFETQLCSNIGHYGASTVENDKLQALSNSQDSVYGSSISGAGLGGNNIVLTHKAETQKVKSFLLNNYYAKREDANRIDLSISDGETILEMAKRDVYLSSSSAPACRLI